MRNTQLILLGSGVGVILTIFIVMNIINKRKPSKISGAKLASINKRKLKKLEIE